MLASCFPTLVQDKKCPFSRTFGNENNVRFAVPLAIKRFANKGPTLVKSLVIQNPAQIHSKLERPLYPTVL